MILHACMSRYMKAYPSKLRKNIAMHIIQLHKTIAMHIIQLNHQFLENIKSMNIYGLDHWFHPFKCFSSLFNIILTIDYLTYNCRCVQLGIGHKELCQDLMYLVPINPLQFCLASNNNACMKPVACHGKDY